MSILLKHVVKNIRENKFRSIVIIGVVLLSTAVSLVVFNLQDIIVYNYDKVYQASVGEANVTIRREDNAPYALDTLNFAGVSAEKQSDIYQFYGRYESGQGVVKANLIGIRLDEYQNMDAVSLLNAPDGFDLGQGECVISVKSAEQYGLAVGDMITVSVREQTHNFRVAAIAESNRTFYEEKGNFQILITLEDANALNRTNGMATKTRLKVDEAEIYEAATRLQAQNNSLTVIQGEEFEQSHYSIATVSGAMLIIVVIIILISAYILYSLVKLIMMDRLPVIGTFRSVGANKGKIIGILLLEFLSYGVIGTVLGLLAGVFILPFIADLFNQYKEFGVTTEVTYRIGYGIAAACIGLLLPVLSSMSHAVRTSRTPLKDIILKPSSKLAETSLKGTLLAAGFLILSFALYIANTADNAMIGFIGLSCLICGAVFSVPIVMTLLSKLAGLFIKTGSGVMGLTNLKSNKTVRSIGSMFMAVILIAVMVGTLADGMKNVIVTEISNSSAYEVIVTVNGEDVRASDLQAMDGVDGALDSYRSFWYGDYSIGRSGVYGISQFDAMTQYIKALKYDGPDLDALLNQTPNGIVIDEYWARVQNFSVGDTLPMYADEQHTKKIGDFTVVGFWDCSSGTTDRAFVGISQNDYERLLTRVPDQILIKTSTPKAVAQAISANYLDTDINAVTMEDFLAEQIAAVDSMLGMMLACVVLGAIIIVCGIVSNLIVSFVQRKKEYAVMYSVCMSKRQLINMVLWEFLLSCVAIWLVAVTTGYALSEFFLAKATSGIGMTLDFRFNFAILSGILTVVLMIHAITTLFPIRRLRKLNVMEELKYE